MCDNIRFTNDFLFQENVGGTTYFYPQEQQPYTSEEPLPLPLPYSMTTINNDGYMYTPTPITSNSSHVQQPQQQQQQKSFLPSTFFMSEDLRNSLLLKNEIANSVDQDSSNLPLEIDNYHSLSLLEASSNLPVPSSTYKAIHSSTGIKYCLRRLHGNSIDNFL
jgi:PAB-dependent poly(A)-specific ribonuclease subunit 3